MKHLYILMNHWPTIWLIVRAAGVFFLASLPGFAAGFFACRCIRRKQEPIELTEARAEAKDLREAIDEWKEEDVRIIRLMESGSKYAREADVKFRLALEIIRGSR